MDDPPAFAGLVSSPLETKIKAPARAAVLSVFLMVLPPETIVISASSHCTIPSSCQQRYESFNTTVSLEEANPHPPTLGQRRKCPVTK
jgi:hypothetical protein